MADETNVGNKDEKKEGSIVGFPKTQEEFKAILEQEKNKILLEENEKKQKELEQVAKEAAAKEKQKLYARLTEQEEENKKLKGLEEARKGEEEKKKKEEEEKRKQALTVEQRLLEMETQLKEKDVLIDEVRTKSGKLIEETLSKVQGILNQKDLEVYKLNKINEANGNIIPELVSGNTVEEINESIERSKKRYNDIIAKNIEKAEKEKLMNGVVPLNNQDKVLNNAQILGLEDIQKMDSKAFKEYSENILRSILQK